MPRAEHSESPHESRDVKPPALPAVDPGLFASEARGDFAHRDLSPGMSPHGSVVTRILHPAKRPMLMLLPGDAVRVAES
jgi:hypothetical protein